MDPIVPVAKSDDDLPAVCISPPPEKEAPPPRGQVAAALLYGMLGGAMFGAGLGFIPFYFVYNTIGATCTGYTGQVGCETAPHAGCVWTDALGAQPVSTLNGSAPVASCKYGDFESVYCPQYATQDACKAHDACVFDFSKEECSHAAGFKSWESGLFSSSYFIGTTIGPLTVNHVLSVLKYRPVAVLYAVLAIVGAAFMHLGRAFDVYGLLLVGFIFFGCSATGTRLTGNLFAFAAVPDPVLAGRLTGVLQPMTELMQLLAALYVYSLRPGDDRSGDQRINTIVHAHLTLWHLFGLLGIACGAFLLKEVDVRLRDGTAAKGGVVIPPEGLLAPLAKQKARLGVGLTCCMALLATGLPAISAYTPVYAKLIVGTEPTVAPLVTSSSGSAAGLLAFLVRRLVSRTRVLMLTGVAGLFCSLCFFGTVVMPGVVTDDSARHALGITGIALFYLFLETCVGSTFFELALSLQPPETRKGGGAVLNAALNVCSLIVAFTFPIAVTSISGGPSGNQRLGWGVMLFVFAAVAVFCFLVQFPCMHPWVAPPLATEVVTDDNLTSAAMTARSSAAATPRSGKVVTPRALQSLNVTPESGAARLEVRSANHSGDDDDDDEETDAARPVESVLVNSRRRSSYAVDPDHEELAPK